MCVQLVLERAARHLQLWREHQMVRFAMVSGIEEISQREPRGLAALHREVGAYGNITEI